MTEQANANPAELAHFGALASRWWDPDGEFRTLHDINPARVELVDQRVGLAGKRIADVGCGGGCWQVSDRRVGGDGGGHLIVDDQQFMNTETPLVTSVAAVPAKFV